MTENNNNEPNKEIKKAPKTSKKDLSPVKSEEFVEEAKERLKTRKERKKKKRPEYKKKRVVVPIITASILFITGIALAIHSTFFQFKCQAVNLLFRLCETVHPRLTT